MRSFHNEHAFDTMYVYLLNASVKYASLCDTICVIRRFPFCYFSGHIHRGGKEIRLDERVVW